MKRQGPDSSTIEHTTDELQHSKRKHEIEERIAAQPMTQCVWPRIFDVEVLTKHLDESLRTGQMTNHGPAAKRLEQEIVTRLNCKKHVAVACASGTAALHALYATYSMLGHDMSSGILVSAFGFPPVLQGNWRNAVLTDVDPIHGGPVLPADGHVPSVICIVNPFGYRVDVRFYRDYCDRHGVLLWFDNAATPQHLMPDGTNLHDIADASTVSLHETKTIGRGEGGVLLVKPELFDVAFRAVNFGYDYSVPPEHRGATYHRAASNYRMSDVAAATILMSWELNWDTIVKWNVEHEDEIVNFDGIPFFKGEKGTFYSCAYEPRQHRPNFEVKYYYYPLLPREKAPVAWRIFDTMQCRPFHPPGGPCPYGISGPNASKPVSGPHSPRGD